MNGKSQERYDDLEEWQLEIINEYCIDDMKKLKIICHSIWIKKGLPAADYDDLYDDAVKVLCESVRSFDKDANTKFGTYLTNNIRKSYGQWYRDNYLRAKRSNLEMENGKIKLVKDENGKMRPVIIMNISFDAPPLNEDDVPLAEKISVKEIEEPEIEYHPEMERYLNRLSKVQRIILTYLSEGYTQEDITKILHITDVMYRDNLRAITDERNIKTIRSLLRR